MNRPDKIAVGIIGVGVASFMVSAFLLVKDQDKEIRRLRRSNEMFRELITMIHRLHSDEKLTREEVHDLIIKYTDIPNDASSL